MSESQRDYPERMSGEQQQQVVPGSIAPLVYSDEEEMCNGHNGDVLPQPKGPVIEEPETDLGHRVAASGSGVSSSRGPQFFLHAPQYHWHSVLSEGTDAEARERLVALERSVFAFGQRTKEREQQLLAQIATLEAQRGIAEEDFRVFQ